MGVWECLCANTEGHLCFAWLVGFGGGFGGDWHFPSPKPPGVEYGLAEPMARGGKQEVCYGTQSLVHTEKKIPRCSNPAIISSLKAPGGTNLREMSMVRWRSARGGRKGYPRNRKVSYTRKTRSHDLESCDQILLESSGRHQPPGDLGEDMIAGFQIVGSSSLCVYWHFADGPPSRPTLLFHLHQTDQFSGRSGGGCAHPPPDLPEGSRRK